MPNLNEDKDEWPESEQINSQMQHLGKSLIRTSIVNYEKDRSSSLLEIISSNDTHEPTRS